jgi:hypothetical protein
MPTGRIAMRVEADAYLKRLIASARMHFVNELRCAKKKNFRRACYWERCRSKMTERIETAINDGHLTIS